MLKLLQEIRGFADITSRRPQPRSPALVVAQIRSHIVQAALPKRRLNVKMDAHDLPDVPHPVKINHVKQAPATSVSLPAS
jgi:hypothetical protein